MLFTLMIVALSAFAWKRMPSEWNNLRRAYSLLLGWVFGYALWVIFIFLVMMAS